MSFQDVFRKSFLEGYASLDIQIGEILLCMVCTLLLSIYIFHVYKMLNRNSFYNKTLIVFLLVSPKHRCVAFRLLYYIY